MNKITTRINNSSDLREVLNQNLEGILTGKRKILIAKEITNVCGKLLADVKMEMMNKAMTGDRTGVEWYSNNEQKRIGK